MTADRLREAAKVLRGLDENAAGADASERWAVDITYSAPHEAFACRADGPATGFSLLLQDPDRGSDEDIVAAVAGRNILPLVADWLDTQADLSARGYTQDPRHAAAARVADLILGGAA